ncbi:hypothetical protein I3760_16G120400 [Carya illinoinensis]|uniref:uncharacterized protein LOC122299527 isoform X1 n=2 Tax=Carya illinoinensis TaxID=32201 RepID=UPI001BF90200|nr:uncharacterized protein LOC122299527 isoform X1 [Carya illinoinensis]KAG2665219.1 hypothetical protein I3760_16G120400 [Carya illinoinensis]
MEFGSQQNDFHAEQLVDGSFKNFISGFSHDDMDLSLGQSLDGSFRKSNSVISAHSISGTSASSKFFPTSRKLFKGLKEYGRKLTNLELFTQSLEDWVLENSCADLANEEQHFSSPFLVDELHKLDLALEGVLFQQLYRMPCSRSLLADELKEDEYLALEDFLHVVANGLWRTFWHRTGPFPFFVSCPRHPGSKFYSVEKSISRGRLKELCGVALLSKPGGEVQVHWDQVMEFVLFKQDILSGNELKFSAGTICEALFYGFHILVSRSLSKISTVSSDSVFLLVLDSRYGGVVKFGGDLSKLDLNSSNPYQAMAEWMKAHAQVSVSSVDRMWNKLGNVNWGDLGTLQVLLATFYTIVQWNGPPRKSIASLAADHSLRLQKRRIECCLVENQSALVPFQLAGHQHGEIVELDQNDNSFLRKQALRLKLKKGEILLLDDQRQGQKSFQIQESLVVGNNFLYSAISLDYPTELLSLYVGAHPSRLEPSWEDMSLWYTVQRQTKVLNILKQRGISSKYLPDIIASGRILHSGPCMKQSPGGRCDHPWCGTPILVTSPVGEPLSSVIARVGPFSSEEAIRCCRDCLAALRSAAMTSVQHGDICPENIILVVDMKGARNSFLYVPISWGRAVLEDRDSPAINLQFSSSHALQHGKLCPASDAESLVYLLFFICGGSIEQQDSIESALQWRERSWSMRLIQQKLGEVSALLKAFADYVDSLCGTPYPLDYDIWLKRLNRAVDGSDDRGKMIEEVAITLRLEDVAESSGTTGGGT